MSLERIHLFGSEQRTTTNVTVKGYGLRPNTRYYPHIISNDACIEYKSILPDP